MILLHTVQGFYEIQIAFQLLHRAGRVYCSSNIGRDRWNPERKFHYYSPTPPPPLYSVLEIQNGWNIQFFRYHYIRQYIHIYIYIYIYIVFISVNTKLVCFFYFISSMFIIFTFYYLPFLSSVMDCSCKVPFSIILILTMIRCDSFYNSVLTKDWGDVWVRGGEGEGLKSLRWVKRNVRRDVCNSSTSIGPFILCCVFQFQE